MADLLSLPHCIRCPIPISTADRALMDIYEVKNGITRVPRGVSGEADEQTAGHRNRTGHRFGQSAELRHKQSQKRQLLRKLVDEKKTGPEIAAETGMKLVTVYTALARLRLKIRPRFDEPRDG